MNGSLGRHILVELYDCNEEVLRDVVDIENYMLEAAKQADATIINSTFHHFSPFGVSGVVVIQESHLAIHTWPEYRYAAVDIYTCGSLINPWIAFDFLKEKLSAKHVSAMELLRGQLHLLPKFEYEIDKIPATNAKPVYERNVWFTERNPNIAFSVRHTGEMLFRETSQYQKVEMYDTLEYGKMLIIDGKVMTTERDEFVYHEAISHVPCLSHPKPEKVLVIGAGDGGVVTQLLKHESISKITIVEIDELVIKASRLHLPQMANSFDNPRVDLRVEDGIAFVKNAPNETYDIVLVDSTDPGGPSEGIFTEDFYRNIHRILKPNGIFTNQSESPWYNTEVYSEIFAVMNRIFGKTNCHPYLANIPTYPSGLWGFCLCSKNGLNPVKDFDMEKAKNFTLQHKLKFYNEEIHRSVFVLPNYVRELLYK